MEWQDISTAPMDGTPVLVFDGENQTVAYLEKGITPYWNLLVCGTWAEDGECFPTHWMPLPAPPKE